MRARALALVVAMLALVLLLSACTAAPGGPGPDTEPDAEPPATSTPTESTRPPDPGPVPEMGACHDLSFGQAVAVVDRTEPVPCRRRHTAETYFVGRLDLRTASGFTRRVDSRAAQKQVRSTCANRLPRHVGMPPRELRLTMVRSVWFTPGPAQAEAGADWFRCDVVVVASPKRLLPLPRRTKGWDDVPAMCATAAPGTRGFRRVTCGVRHTWRAVSTVDIPGRRLPGENAVAARMESTCRDAARSSADDPLDFSWSQESPTQQQWDSGQHYGICWVPA